MTEVTARRFRPVSATTAVILGALTLVLAVLYVPLAWPGSVRDFRLHLLASSRSTRFQGGTSVGDF